MANYLDPHELREQIRIYQRKIRNAAGRRRRQIPASSRKRTVRGSRCPERLGELLLLIARHLAERPNFSGYTYDLAADAMPDMLRACAKFDLSRTTAGRPASAFAYLTQTAWYSFVHTIKREARRGIKGGAPDAPLEVSGLPNLYMGQFDAVALRDAILRREATLPTP